MKQEETCVYTRAGCHKVEAQWIAPVTATLHTLDYDSPRTRDRFQKEREPLCNLKTSQELPRTRGTSPLQMEGPNQPTEGLSVRLRIVPAQRKVVSCFHPSERLKGLRYSPGPL